MAAHILKFVYGATTVNLYDGNDYTYLMGYELRGGGPGLTVTETIKLQLHYASDDAVNAALRAKLNGIVAAAREAEMWQESRGRAGTQTFLKIQAGGSGDTAYRSEVVHIAHDIPAEWLYGNWPQHVLDVTLTVTRRNFWEADSLTTLVNGTTIYNHDDGDANHDNYVEVLAAAAGGSLPAPVKLLFENTHNDPHEYTEVWAGQGTWADVANFDHILEGEDADFNVGGAGAVSPAADCSNNAYLPATWAVGTETLLYRWDDLTRAYMNESMAKRFRVLARFQAAPGAVSLRMALTYPSGTTTLELQTTGAVLADASNLLYDLGELDIPPWLERETADWNDMSLCLYGTIAGGTTVNLDFVHLQPIDSGRHYRYLTAGTEYQEWLGDDPDTGHIYHRNSSTYKSGKVVGTGDGLLLWPGRINRFYFLWRDASGSDITNTAAVFLYYRPRRQTL